mmetsp:Transcript_76358/g.159025  ORF Transcript_76358/g.159025 Transcript_76358/m.159025 type:complete len:88 (-) Transcript_76358:46-309(-)
MHLLISLPALPFPSRIPFISLPFLPSFPFVPLNQGAASFEFGQLVRPRWEVRPDLRRASRFKIVHGESPPTWSSQFSAARQVRLDLA